MHKRSPALLVLSSLLAGIVVFAKLPSMAAGGIAVKTEWGHPDLQGIWAQKYQVPLQRPPRDAGKPLLTPEEVKQRETERAQQAASAPKRGDRIAARGPWRT